MLGWNIQMWILVEGEMVGYEMEWLHNHLSQNELALIDRGK